MQQLTEKLQGSETQLQQEKISAWRQQLAKQVSKHTLQDPGVSGSRASFRVGVYLNPGCQTEDVHQGLSLIVLKLETGACNCNTCSTFAA